MKINTIKKYLVISIIFLFIGLNANLSGINIENIIAYLALNNVIACGGSWIVKKDLIASRDFEEIAKLVTTAISLINSEIK